MNDLLVERFFSVAVELTDGRSTQLKVRGETPAEAFKEVRARADVRRVGKVLEIDESAFHSDKPLPSSRPQQSPSGSSSGSSNQGQRDRQADGQADRPADRQADRPADRHGREPHQSGSGSTAPREALIGFTISGPRVIRAAKPLGYEQPFKNFRSRPGAVNIPPPPEPNKPKFSPFGPVKGPVANDPSRPPVFAKPAPAGEENPAVKPTAPQGVEDATDEATDSDAAVGVSSATTPREYRIQKSRRQSGEPYLLQRGTWSMVKGKRTFSVEWEKGFPTREKAVKQHTWLEQMSRETAEIQASDAQ